MVGSLSLAALFGIYGLLFSGGIDPEGRIIGTTLSIGLFSLTALGAAVVFERGRWRPVMLAAFVVSGIGALFYLYVIWLHEHLFPSRWFYSEFIWKAMFVLAIGAIALPHMGLIALAPREAAPLRWARRLSILCVAILTTLLISVIVLEPTSGVAEDIVFRLAGVFGILAALGTITVPILVRVQRIDKTMQTESTQLALQLTCPRCLKAQTVHSGHTRCVQCRLKFHIEIEEPRCPNCNYLLHMLTEPKCPECGRALGAEELPGDAAAPNPDASPTVSPDAPSADPARSDDTPSGQH